MSRMREMKLIHALFCMGATLAFAQPPAPALTNPPAPLPFVSPIFGDNMVLQRGKPNTIWGWSQPGDTVRVELLENSATGTAGTNGKWQVRIQPPAPGGPYSLKITGRQTVELHNVLVGDVWIAAGQSNMQFGLGQARNAADEIKNANYPEIRFFVVGQRGSYRQADVPSGTWKVVSPDSVSGRGGISAVAYFFARRIQRDLRIPIGLVQAAVGGVPAETFTSPERLRPLQDFSAGLDEVERHARNGAPEYGTYIAHWYDDYDIALKNGQNWADPQWDSAAWKPVQIPGTFHELGISDIPSLTWFRKEITLPDPVPKGQARVYLGQVDKMDTTFVNGRQIGASSWVENPRVYGVPDGVLKPGRNVIAIRLFKVKPGGSFLGKPEELRLTLGDGASIPLSGEWKGKVSVDIRPPHPLPIRFENSPSMPSILYNGMLVPIAPMAITGALWYQGESNAERAFGYGKLLPALIADWRKSFGQGDFPFYIAGLPFYKVRSDVPKDDSWAELREVQATVAKTVPHTCLAVTIDTGNADDVHPVDKVEVGERLGLCALGEQYGKSNPYKGPTLSKVEPIPGGFRLRFDHADGGLVVRGTRLGEFSIAGEDRKWYWADARIEGDTVVVSTTSVANPKAVRYAWQANPEATLFNGAGLPAVPFRTDNWPGITEGRR
jgi:sialate O-acetylesterase